jgi:hypothetical protein
VATSVRTVTADVVRVDFGGCVVKWTDGTLVRARARGRLMGERKALGNTVVVGDRALLETPRHIISALSVGKVAPEIAGADLDGSPMRLSDYRGKVVHVASWADPEFRAGLADRIFCQASTRAFPPAGDEQGGSRRGPGDAGCRLD